MNKKQISRYYQEAMNECEINFEERDKQLQCKSGVSAVIESMMPSDEEGIPDYMSTKEIEESIGAAKIVCDIEYKKSEICRKGIEFLSRKLLL